MARPPEGKRQASFPGAVFFFAGGFPGAARTVLRTVRAAPSQAHNRVITPMQPASSTAPKRSSIQKTHLLSTQRST